MTDHIPVDVVRAVRVLDAMKVPAAVVVEVTGCPPALAPEIAAGRLGGDYDADVVRSDMALVAAVDKARRAAAAEPGLDAVIARAQWLAEQSGHPRYTQIADGWKTLLVSSGDVEIAYNAALRRIGDLPGLSATRAADELRAARETVLKAAKAAEEVARR